VVQHVFLLLKDLEDLTNKKNQSVNPDEVVAMVQQFKQVF
jgi:hypothetical protein